MLGASNDEPEPGPVRTLEPAAVPMEVVNLQPHMAPIYKITGSPTSYENAMANNMTKSIDSASIRRGDLGCSWLALLDALNDQERISRTWDRGYSKSGLNHTICYFFQRQRCCWDMMPPGVTKPVATTTISHLVEIMSMLGLVWTEFNVKASVLFAEGNGYTVSTEYVSNLGILARFSNLSRPRHDSNRIIPCAEIKSLCFSEVPSIFDDMGQKLQVGPQRLDACLENLLPRLAPRCREAFLSTTEAKLKNQPLSRKYPNTIAPVYLLFSGRLIYHSLATFELIGMIAKSCHIHGSRFRRLPNPCADPPPRTLKMAVCLREFAFNLRKSSIALGTDVLTLELQTGMLPDGRSLEQLIESYLSAKAAFERAGRSFIPFEERENVRRAAEYNHDKAIVELMDALHFVLGRIDERLRSDEMREGVRSVITAHFAC